MNVNFKNLTIEQKQTYAQDIVLFAEEVMGMNGEVVTVAEGHTLQRTKLQPWERMRLRNYREWMTTATAYHAYVRPTNVENNYLHEVYETHQALILHMNVAECLDLIEKAVA